MGIVVSASGAETGAASVEVGGEVVPTTTLDGTPEKEVAVGADTAVASAVGLGTLDGVAELVGVGLVGEVVGVVGVVVVGVHVGTFVGCLGSFGLWVGVGVGTGVPCSTQMPAAWFAAVSAYPGRQSQANVGTAPPTRSAPVTAATEIKIGAELFNPIDTLVVLI